MQAAFPTTDRSVAALFDGMPGAHSMVRAALHGMGRVLADAPRRPRCALAQAGDFLYCGGQPGHSAAHLLRTAFTAHEGEWLVYAPEPWRAVLQHVAPYDISVRYAFDHAVQPRDEALHDLLAAVPPDVTFQPIEGAWIARCREAAWSRDFVSQYDDALYARQGLGVLLFANGQLVAGASSYVSYPGGIEIQLQTRDECQGRGYATWAAAKLILMAHARGMIATWDAANPASAHIAAKLGYQSAGQYEVSVVRRG